MTLKWPLDSMFTRMFNLLMLPIVVAMVVEVITSCSGVVVIVGTMVFEVITHSRCKRQLQVFSFPAELSAEKENT